eukprot:gene11869-2417_t
MDACNSVERELDKLLGRFDQFRGNLEKLDDLIKHIQSTKNGLDGGYDIGEAKAKKRKKHLNFVSDFTGTTQEGIFSGNEAVLLNEAISEHLLRQGHVDVADMLIQEANLTLDEKQKEPFLELNRILEECKNHNVEPALRDSATNGLLCFHEDWIGEFSILGFAGSVDAKRTLTIVDDKCTLTIVDAKRTLTIVDAKRTLALVDAKRTLALVDAKCTLAIVDAKCTFFSS